MKLEARKIYQTLNGDQSRYASAIQDAYYLLLTHIRTKAIKDSTRYLMLIFPDLGWLLGEMQAPPSRCLRLLHQCPHAAMLFVHRRYEEHAPEYEKALFYSPECIYLHLAWAAMEDVRLRMPIARYTDLLIQSPAWAFQWNERFAIPQLAERISAFAEEHKGQYAAAAYAYLIIHEDEPVAPYIPMLRNHSEYAFLAFANFRHRDLDVSQIIPPPEIFAPRWAYHFALALNDYPELQKKAEDAMLPHLDWLVEYAIDSSMDITGERWSELICRAMSQPQIGDQAEAHGILRQHFHIWNDEIIKSKLAGTNR